MTARVRRLVVAVACIGLSIVVAPSRASDRTDLATRACAAIDDAVRALPAGPVLLASYRPTRDESAPALDPALRDVAFTYDNALAVVALYACGKAASARRIADALAIATTADPEYRDGRVRNAYAAGPVDATAMRLPGFWSAERNAWIQDAYQVSVATGNAAWAALALLEAYRRDRRETDLAAARRVLAWVARDARDDVAPAGFVGGFFVTPQGPVRQSWKSTEHNTDLAAAWTLLGRLAPDDAATRNAAFATAFVRSQWHEAEGRFLIGTGPDGRTSDHDRSGLDAQLWPLIAIDRPPAEWMRALAFVDRWHAVDGGFGYNRAPDGLWTEGTAQAAAVFVLRGLPARAAPLWPLLKAQQDETGWLVATPKERVRTGLAIGPDSTTSDFYYLRLPHLGATAWAAIAAKGVNPFGGR